VDNTDVLGAIDVVVEILNSIVKQLKTQHELNQTIVDALVKLQDDKLKTHV
tara:strand:+ start:224 stop:376 length:153 start_codon:yes stop_codon:yes gene_type:complete